MISRKLCRLKQNPTVGVIATASRHDCSRRLVLLLRKNRLNFGVKVSKSRSAKLWDSIRIRIGCPDSNSIRKWRADSKISNRPHMPCAVIPQTTLTHCSTKNINLCAVCSWDLCLQLHFACSCTAVARAHTHTLAPYRSDRAILFEEPNESTHLCCSYNIQRSMQ